MGVDHNGETLRTPHVTIRDGQQIGAVSARAPDLEFI